MEVSLEELALTFVVPFLSCSSSAMFASVKRSFQVSSQPSLESWRQLFVLHRQRRDRLFESLRVLEYRTHYALPRLGSHSPAELIRNVCWATLHVSRVFQALGRSERLLARARILHSCVLSTDVSWLVHRLREGVRRGRQRWRWRLGRLLSTLCFRR